MKRIKNVLRPTSRVLWAGFVCLLLWLTAQPGVWAVPGDIVGNGLGADPNGFVGVDDLNRVLSNWNVTCDPGDWTQGDITGDGFVGVDDLSIILGHWNQADPDPFLGTNLGPIEYWKSHWVFVDAFKMARNWQSSGGTVDTDPNGWPKANPGGQTVFTHVFTDLNGAYPGGDYILTYEGTANVTVTGDVSSVTLPDPGNVRRKKVSVIPAGGGIHINIDSINIGDPIKNIRLWMPGFENAPSPFHPLFVSRLKTFKVLRFMDWQKTNGSDEVQWSDRKQPTYAFQSDNSGGVALEYIIELCNELEADPWFCMPHQAAGVGPEDYVTEFAKQVKTNLHADAKIYIEWSNEVWNAKFSQYEYTGGPWGGSSDPFFLKWATEAGIDFEIWRTVFDSDPHEREIVRVMAGQKTNDWVLQSVLNKPGLAGTGSDVLFDAVACSTYFYKKLDGNSTADSILQNALDHIPVDDASDYVDHAAFASQYTSQAGRPISFISYEGGQHYVFNPDDPPNNPDEDVALEMQRHPKMYQAYIKNIAAFKDAGGTLYVPFNSVGKWTYEDTFGLIEFQDQSIHDAPKHRAVIGGGGR